MPYHFKICGPFWTMQKLIFFVFSPFNSSIKLCMMPEFDSIAAHASSMATVPTSITTSRTRSSSAAPVRQRMGQRSFTMHFTIRFIFFPQQTKVTNLQLTTLPRLQHGESSECPILIGSIYRLKFFSLQFLLGHKSLKKSTT